MKCLGTTLYVSPRKCSFMQSETAFLGLIVGAGGIRVNPDKVKVVQEWPRPKSLSDLRSFVGLLQFFRRFIKNFSAIAAPLTSLTKKDSGIHRWDTKCDNAFQVLKTAITTAPVLIAPNWSKPFRCHIDASQRAAGGTLTQLDDSGADRVIAYFSRKLFSTEENYTANERELLGLVYFLKRFRCYLEGTSFGVFTDNQVLKHFFTKPSLNRKESRWLDLLAQFGISKISLKPGRVHVLGDVLSRAPHVKQELSSDLELSNLQAHSVAVHFNFADKYMSDQLFGDIVRGLRDEMPTDAFKRDRLVRLLPLFREEKGLLFYKEKLCVPRQCVREILFEAHDSKVGGHFAAAKTLGRLENFHWKHKTRDVMNYCRGCVSCRQQKNSNQKKFTVPTPLDVRCRRWGSVATDFIVGLPRTAQGHDSISTWVDRLSRRVHFLPSRATDTAVDVANAFFSNIFPHHGLPDAIVSDRDPKFTSHFWSHLLSLCGIRAQMSTSHHPQKDGASEVMNRMVEVYLRCGSYRQNDWDVLLPAAEFAYNSAVSEQLGTSPFEVDLEWKPLSPLDVIHATGTPLRALHNSRPGYTPLSRMRSSRMS